MIQIKQSDLTGGTFIVPLRRTYSIRIERRERGRQHAMFNHPSAVFQIPVEQFIAISPIQSYFMFSIAPNCRNFVSRFLPLPHHPTPPSLGPQTIHFYAQAGGGKTNSFTPHYSTFALPSALHKKHLLQQYRELAKNRVRHFNNI